MSIYIKDEATDAAVRKLAKLKGLSLTEAIRLAVESELIAEAKKKPVAEFIKEIQDRIAARPATGLEADKAFFDELSGM